MPTGYTAGIQDGTYTEFRDYALHAARNFGACIMQRDDSAKDLPKFREESAYYKDAYTDALKAYLEWIKSDDEQKLNKFNNDKEIDIKYHLSSIERNNVELERYKKFLNWSKSYNPPTRDHLGYKNFLVEQITSSIDWDCSSSYHENEINRINSRVFETWCEEKEEALYEKCTYSLDGWLKEQKRVRESNKWIQDLYDSLDEWEKEQRKHMTFYKENND